MPLILPHRLSVLRFPHLCLLFPSLHLLHPTLLRLFFPAGLPPDCLPCSSAPASSVLPQAVLLLPSLNLPSAVLIQPVYPDNQKAPACHNHKWIWHIPSGLKNPKKSLLQAAAPGKTDCHFRTYIVLFSSWLRTGSQNVLSALQSGFLLHQSPHFSPQFHPGYPPVRC